MKTLLPFLFIILLSVNLNAQDFKDSAEERQSLDKATLAIRNAFAKGDVSLIVQLHSPNIVKYFGGTNVVIGRTALEKGLTDLFKNSKLEFVENTVESTVFNGNTAIQTVVFAIKTTPKKGGISVTGRGRSMVVYIRDKSSPTGWLSLREMAQEAPAKSE